MRVRTGWIARPAVVALVVASAITVQAVASGGPAGPQPDGDLPAGFTDGTPVGGEPGSGDPPPDGGAPFEGGAPTDGDVTASAATQRYFGEGPWNAIVAASAATPRTCTLSDADLTAMVVAPVFKESSAATTPQTAPAPMTLSRYDEWSGTLGGDSNVNANYGLYAFRDPSTPYQRAFWHPGIGIWQYDTAGVGAPFTAVERMDVSVVAADVAAGMASRYCNPSSSVVGHPAPFTDQERRYSAWWPWGYPCTACQALFDDLTAGEPDFANVTLVAGITATGGVAARTCSLQGVAGTLPCWYVNPSVGVIEGSTAWATLDPSGGNDPTAPPTPLARPFYVLDRGATEERHWLKADTGYDIDISGSRTIGKNDRPRTNQAGSGVTWSASSGLCDITVGRGLCAPVPPAGMTSTLTAVNATFRPIALDAHGDGKGDILWYAPGPAPDFLWSGQGRGTFTSTQLAVTATYDDVEALDADGDGDDDLVWYRRSTGAAYLWRAKGDGTWTSSALSVGTDRRPIVVDTDGNGADEVLWYGPGSVPDVLMGWNGSVVFVRKQSVAGRYVPITGDFDGNDKTDVLWYAPGSAPDAVWYHTGLGTHASVGKTVTGSYAPLVGDLDGDGRDDVFWYAPGPVGDSVWYGTAGRSFTIASHPVSSSYQPQVVDLGGDGRDDIVWYAPGPRADSWWRWGTDRVLTSAGLVASGEHQAIVGGFSTGGADGIFWYAPGSAPDATWWR